MWPRPAVGAFETALAKKSELPRALGEVRAVRCLFEHLFWLNGEAGGDVSLAIEDPKGLIAEQAATLAFDARQRCQFDATIARIAGGADSIGFFMPTVVCRAGADLSSPRIRITFSSRSIHND